MRKQVTMGEMMPSRDDSDESDDLNAKAEKYRDHEFDRQIAEYEAKLHEKPPIWNRAWFYAAIGVALTILLYFIFGR